MPRQKMSLDQVPHGTIQGYDYEIRHKLPTCDKCRKAQAEHRKQWREDNPEKARAADAKFREKHKEKRALAAKVYKEQNKDELSIAYRSWYEQNRDSVADRRMMNRFKMSLADYEEKLASQCGCCAICGSEDSATKGKRFSIDHDRACCPGYKSCGKCVRGLLCTRCNTAIGSFRDDIELFNKAIAYVKFYRLSHLDM